MAIDASIDAGVGDAPPATAPSRARKPVGPKVLFAPRLDAAPSAGGGVTPARERVLEQWPLPERWLRIDLGVEPAMADVVQVRGDSMAPTFLDGDLVVVDRGDTLTRGSGVFVLWDGDVLRLKRVQAMTGPPDAPPRLRLLSDNPAYAPEEVEAAWISIIGRARARIAKV